MPDEIPELRFECPECKDFRFGSNLIRNTRHCGGCRFTWSIIDDHLYLKPTGRMLPRTGTATTTR